MKNYKNPTNFIIDTVKNYKFGLVYLFLDTFLFERCISIFFLPYILKIFGDSYALGTLTEVKAVFLAFLYAFFCALGPLFLVITEKPMHYNYFVKMQRDIKRKLLNYTLNHSINFFNNNMAGNLASKVNTISESIFMFINYSCTILSGIAIFLVTLIVYFNINFYLGLFIMFWVVAYCTSQYYISKYIYKNKYRRTETYNETSGIMTDDFVNILNIKSFSSQRREIANIRKQSVKILKNESNVLVVKSISNIVMFFLSFSLLAVVLGTIFYMILNGKSTLGMFLYTGQNIILTRHMITDIYRQNSDWISYYADIKEGLNTLIKPQEIRNKDNAEILKNIDGKIIFRNINFSYR